MWPQRFRKVSFSSVYTYTRKQRFQKVPFSLIFFTGYVWTEAVPVKKKLRFQMKTYTCGRGLSYSKHKIWILIANVFQESKMFHQTTFFYSDRLHITPRRHNCLSQAVILYLPAISSLPLPRFAKAWRPLVKNITDVYFFLLRHSLLRTFQETWAFFSGFKRSRMQVVICWFGSMLLISIMINN